MQVCVMSISLVNRSQLAYLICGSIKKEKVLKMSLKLLLLKLIDTELALCLSFHISLGGGGGGGERGMCSLVKMLKKKRDFCLLIFSSSLLLLFCPT